MNTSYNYADFVGLSLESSDDYEPYGYACGLREIEAAGDNASTASIESLIFASTDGYD